MQAGTVIVWCTKEDLSKLKRENNEASISVIKTSKLWQLCDKSRATSLKGEKILDAGENLTQTLKNGQN